MLTGKAKKDFERWYSDTDSEMKHSLQKSLFYSKSYIERYAYYLEWLDSVGLYIEIGVYPSDGTDPNFTINYSYAMFGLIYLDGDLYLTRQEATRAAIEQANKIYNER